MRTLPAEAPKEITRGTRYTKVAKRVVTMLKPMPSSARLKARKKIRQVRYFNESRGNGFTKAPRPSFGKIWARRRQARKSRQFNRARAKA